MKKYLSTSYTDKNSSGYPELKIKYRPNFFDWLFGRFEKVETYILIKSGYDYVWVDVASNKPVSANKANEIFDIMINIPQISIA